MSPIDQTLTSRFECKYFVPEDQVPAVRTLIRPFMRPDEYAARCPGNRYTISSLYYDSPELDLFRSTEEGHKNRFKLRVRSYSDDPKTPVFFEIKRRVDGVVLKRRAPLERPLAKAQLTPGAARGARGGSLPPAVAEFLNLRRELAAQPVLHVRYTREAYMARGRAPARVTLDRELSRGIGGDGLPTLGGVPFRPTPTPGVILEVKFTDDTPTFVHGLIERLELMRRSIPKYVLCVRAARADGSLRRASAGLRRVDHG